jgi:hypothetical protein
MEWSINSDKVATARIKQVDPETGEPKLIGPQLLFRSGASWNRTSDLSIISAAL